MSSSLRILVFLVLAVACLAGAAEQIVLDSSYSVHLDVAEPTDAERTALSELGRYYQLVFGQNKPGTHGIFLRRDGALGREEFTIRTSGDGDVLIVGGRPAGLLYGVYYFLDRICGVHWFTPEEEYVPRTEQKKIPPIDYRGRPAFPIRLIQIADRYKRETQAEKLFAMRNLVHDFESDATRYDGNLDYCPVCAPPYPCHALHMIISPAKYFGEHPEFWALQDGVRSHRDERGVSADYCLTNKELIRATVREVRRILRNAPRARVISLQEGDGTRGFCECPSCRAMQRELGGKWSGLWLYFTNSVAEQLEKEFPDVLFKMFAYDKSKEAPDNILARRNVAVELCAWLVQRGLPYASPDNPNGARFLENLRKWRRITPNLLIWDYVYSHGDRFIQTPDLLHNIDNLRFFKSQGVRGVFAEGAYARAVPQTGYPFKTWLIARALWNPDECGDGRQLLHTFCEEYYGKEAGGLIERYHLLLHDENVRQKFYCFTSVGPIGNAEFESRENTLKAYGLFQQALKAAAANHTYAMRVKNTMIPLRYHMIAKNIFPPGTNRKTMSDELLEHANAILPGLSRSEKNQLNNFIRRLDRLPLIFDIDASASQCIGPMVPARAFDGDLKTYWISGCDHGWIQRKFQEPRRISSIQSILSTEGNDWVEYQIESSSDGEKYLTVVPRKKVFLQKNARYVFAVDQLEPPCTARFVRTRIFHVRMEDGRRNDVTMHEQLFNETKPMKGLFH